jgi:hypothetical protein
MGWKPPASSKRTRAKVRGQRRKTKKTREMSFSDPVEFVNSTI